MDKLDPAHVCGARSREIAELVRRRIETVLKRKQLVED